MTVSAAMVKELREISGAGMSACKDALVEASGDIKRAVEVLREKGLATAAKKAGRIAAEGLVAVALSPDNKKGAIVEVNSETDFVAKNEDFVTFVTNMSKQALESSATTVDTLLAEKWIADPSQTAQEVLVQKVSTIGENLGLRRFERYEAGANGVIVQYMHGGAPVGGRVAVMLELATAEVNDSIIEAGRNLCMQIAAMSPLFVARKDVPEDFIAKEKEILLQQAINEGKPENIAEKMVEGRLKKNLVAMCLLEQEYVREADMTCAQYIASVGEGITVKRFKRYETGEGVEKKVEDFAEEVNKAMGK